MHRIRLLVSLVALALIVGAPARASSSGLVVSQVYAGGGNSGASFANDFVELFNRGSTSIDLGSWSIPYASAPTSGRSPLAGSMQPGRPTSSARFRVGRRSVADPDTTGTTCQLGGGRALGDALPAALSGLLCGLIVVDLLGCGSARTMRNQRRPRSLARRHDSRAAAAYGLQLRRLHRDCPVARIRDGSGHLLVGSARRTLRPASTSAIQPVLSLTRGPTIAGGRRQRHAATVSSASRSWQQCDRLRLDVTEPAFAPRRPAASRIGSAGRSDPHRRRAAGIRSRRLRSCDRSSGRAAKREDAAGEPRVLLADPTCSGHCSGRSRTP